MEVLMDAMTLDTLSLEDLKALQKNVTKAIESFEARRKAEARAAVEAQAREFGFSLKELVEADKGSKRAPAQPKYRHPENPELTWSGRGRKPRWIIEAENAGRSLDDLLI